ncbi:MAG: sialate O-acetylesterase [Lentisphaeria bacterium]|nr:sialate O-acetylesterase [Lentisphaeria bacterium]
MPADAKPGRMTITGKTKTLSLDNVLVGDVWVIGGQSNMQHPLSRVEDGQLEIVSANFPEIRLLTVPAMIDNKEKKGFPRLHRWESNHHEREGDWDVCSPRTVREFSGVGYVFGRRLHMASKVPIGLIDASRWGTTVEAWTPLAVLKAMDSDIVKAQLASWDEKVATYDAEKDLESRIQRYNKRMADQKQEANNPPSDLQPGPETNQNYPGNCYASMIAPIAGFAVKGAIYHQGFNNSRADAAAFYYQVFPKMIGAWRAAFNDPTMAFGIISLCTDGTPQTLDNYVESMMNFGIYVREAQYKTFLDFYKAGDKNIGFAIAGKDKKFEPATAESLVTGKDGRGRAQFNRKVLVLSSPYVPAPFTFAMPGAEIPWAIFEWPPLTRKTWRSRPSEATIGRFGKCRTWSRPPTKAPPGNLKKTFARF